MEPFHKRFNIKIDIQDAKKRFINRAYNEIFDRYFQLTYTRPQNKENKRNLIRRVVASALGMKYEHTVSFEQYIGLDFHKCLQAVEAMYSNLQYHEEQRVFEILIKNIMSMSEHDLGIAWRDGHFVPSGAKLLDDALVNENLKWLEDNDLKNILDPFNMGLLHYSESVKNPKKLKDVITDMHEALEATAKWITNSNSDLSSNTVKFIEELGFSREHREMLKAYVTYANRYFRHAQNAEEQPVSISPSEAENFIYMTGLFIRFAIEKFKEISSDC